MYICTFLENRARHLNIPSKIRTSKNVHNNIFSTFGHFENKLYLVTNSPHFFVFFFCWIFFTSVCCRTHFLVIHKIYIIVFVQGITWRKSNNFLLLLNRKSKCCSYFYNNNLLPTDKD